MVPLTVFLEWVAAVGVATFESVLSYVAATQAIELLKGKSISELTKDDMKVIAAALKRFITSFSGQDVSAPDMREKMDQFNHLESELQKKGYTIQQLVGDTVTPGDIDRSTVSGHLSGLALDLARIAQAIFGSASTVNIDRVISLVKRIKRVSEAEDEDLRIARALRATIG